jgi:hypothetical protein
VEGVNAAEQANSLESTTKIASVVGLFKAQFPDVNTDLKPWANDPDTRELVDPDSIDIGFHLPGWSPRYQCRSMLVQIRLFSDPQTQLRRTVGLEVAGFSHQGEQWRLSTIAQWQFEGAKQPKDDIAEQLRLFCRQTFQLFNGAD